MNMPKKKEETTPGTDCECGAYSEHECGCYADWTDWREYNKCYDEMREWFLERLEKIPRFNVSYDIDISHDINGNKPPIKSGVKHMIEIEYIKQIIEEIRGEEMTKQKELEKIIKESDMYIPGMGLSVINDLAKAILDAGYVKLGEGKPEDIQCPVCGFYCLGKGGHGCIDKPYLYKEDINASKGEK